MENNDVAFLFFCHFCIFLSKCPQTKFNVIKLKNVILKLENKYEALILNLFILDYQG